MLSISISFYMQISVCNIERIFNHLAKKHCENACILYNISNLGSDHMKLFTKDDDVIITIECENQEEKQRILNALSTFSEKIQVCKDGRSYRIELSDILYFDTVDKKTFVYTMKDTYEVNLRLYEIIDQMDERFIRINKSCILNFDKLLSIEADFGGRIMCTLLNKERLSVSRQYAPDFKRKLGGS